MRCMRALYTVMLYFGERREAGLGCKLADWLSVSGLAEVESEYQDYNLSGENKTGESGDPAPGTLQLGVNFILSERVAAELVFEDGVNSGFSITDEGMLRYEGGSPGIEAGIYKGSRQ